MVGRPMPQPLAEQGASMLEATVSDCMSVGAEVLTTLDVRCKGRCRGAWIREIDDQAFLKPTFDRLVQEADATLVIAPETGNVLADWVTRLDGLGGGSLGCDLTSIRLCGDKRALSMHLWDHRVPTPKLFEGAVPEDAFPVIIKPIDGAGCEQTFVCRGPADLKQLDNTVTSGSIVQQCCNWPQGISVGVSILVTDGAVEPLICRRQCINLSGDGPIKLSYRGGVTMPDRTGAGRAAQLASRAVSSVPGLRGIVGVDVVLGEVGTEDVVIEINPRITLSYASICLQDRRRIVVSWLVSRGLLRTMGAAGACAVPSG